MSSTRVIKAKETVRLTADVLLITPSQPQDILLIRRRHDPCKGLWALPGGHVETGESTADAARRELAEETGVIVDHLELMGVYAAPGRDPRGRYVAFVYYSLVSGAIPVPVAGDDAAGARWWPVDAITDQMMAFDHYSIITDTLQLLKERNTSHGEH